MDLSRLDRLVRYRLGTQPDLYHPLALLTDRLALAVLSRYLVHLLGQSDRRFQLIQPDLLVPSYPLAHLEVRLVL